MSTEERSRYFDGTLHPMQLDGRIAMLEVKSVAEYQIIQILILIPIVIGGRIVSRDDR